MLHFLPVDMNFFGELATSDLITLMKSLNESLVPRAVLSPSLGIDSIQKCLWILRKKFKFQTTKKNNHKHFQCLNLSLKALLEITSEVETKTILMGHPTLCCHALVVRSFFIHSKMIISP
jgi:hypothetical protein